MTQLTCKADFVIMNAAGCFCNAGKAHGIDKTAHKVKIFRFIETLFAKNVVVVYKEFRF